MKRPIPIKEVEKPKFKLTPAEEVYCELRTEVRINEGKIKYCIGIERDKEKEQFYVKKKELYQELINHLQEKGIEL